MQLTSSVADPSCSSTQLSSVEMEMEMEVEEESGWTDCFTWDNLLYTGRDLATTQISSPNKPSTQSTARNYELIAADVILAKEARECLIADHSTAVGLAAGCNLKALRSRQSQRERFQLTKADTHVCGTKLADDPTVHNHPCIVRASSTVSDASSGPAFSFLVPSPPQPLKQTTSRLNDGATLLNSTLPIDRPTRGKLGIACKRVRGAVDDTAVQDTCSKTRRTITPSSVHLLSSLSAALPAATPSHLQWSAAEVCSPASSRK